MLLDEFGGTSTAERGGRVAADLGWALAVLQLDALLARKQSERFGLHETVIEVVRLDLVALLADVVVSDLVHELLVQRGADDGHRLEAEIFLERRLQLGGADAGAQLAHLPFLAVDQVEDFV